MKVKVIKETQGLEIGDILTYNENKYAYELIKQHEDISETKTITTKTKYSLAEWMVLENKDIFTFIDDDGNDINIVNNIDSTVQPSNSTVAYDTKKNIEELTLKVKELEDKLGKTYIPYPVYDIPQRYYNNSWYTIGW